MTEETPLETSDLLTRHAHLTELTVNRYMAGELRGAELDFAEQHMETCEPCQARVEAVKEFDVAFSILPPGLQADQADEPAGGAVVSLEAERAKRTPTLAVIGTLLAAAAAIAVVFIVGQGQPAHVAPGELDDGIRLKGKGLTLEVQAKTDSDEPRVVADGDVVHPGDRLGFKVSSRQQGFAMIAGVDDSGQPYLGWPRSQGGEAEFLPKTDGPRELKAAIRLDDVGSKERLVLARCPKQFRFVDLAGHLKAGRALRGKPNADPMSSCVYDEVTLRKRQR